MEIMFYIQYIAEEGEEMSPSFRKFLLRWEIFWFVLFAREKKAICEIKRFKN